jgi:hypothetical protein
MDIEKLNRMIERAFIGQAGAVSIVVPDRNTDNMEAVQAIVVVG